MAADYASSVPTVLAAFGDERYWLARLDASTGEAHLDQLTRDSDGAITVRTTEVLDSDTLPALVRQVYPGDLRVERSEHWSPVSGGSSTATVTGAVPGAPVRLAGNGTLSPAHAGSHLQLTVSVEVRIPLVGGKIEEMLGGQLRELIAYEQRFTTEWLTGRS
ncbi:hypothetical protein MBRU_04630 [Mycolicibacterium brumae DSM 44177]|nr:hypothetical protein MBRU_04630 [Mycolicibacterium brumae DSM 44177]